MLDNKQKPCPLAYAVAKDIKAYIDIHKAEYEVWLKTQAEAV